MGSLESTDTSTTQLLHLMLTEHHQREDGKDYESQRTNKSVVRSCLLETMGKLHL